MLQIKSKETSKMVKEMNNKFLVYVIFGVSLFFSSVAFSAGENALKHIEMRAADKSKIEILLEFVDPVVNTQSFALEDPAMIALDFSSSVNLVPEEVLEQLTTAGVLKSIKIVETPDRMRVLVNLKKNVGFDVEEKANIVVVTLSEQNEEEKSTRKRFTQSGDNYKINSFDFRRGERGEARLIVDLSESKVTIDVEEDREQTMIRFVGATMDKGLEQRYNVADFATPVKSISVSANGDNVEMIVGASGDFDKVAYQMDNQFIFEVRDKNSEASTDSSGVLAYTGNRISLNFQDIDVRAVLQIIADFSGFNIITNDSVQGSITLRLQNLPWDQALDIILKSKGLDKREVGNVMLIGPAEEIANRERLELEGKRQIEDLGQLKSELIQVNYASASDIAALLKDQSTSLLTARGAVSVDSRTNTLLVQDIASKLLEIRELLTKIDIPIRQVEIATQIITADDTLEKALGIKFGGAANSGIGSRRVGIGSTVDRARAIADFSDVNNTAAVPSSSAVIAPDVYNGAGPTVNNTEGFFSDLKVFDGSSFSATGITPASVGLALARLPNGTLLDLELQALEYESRTKTIAKPRLITLDQNTASVQKGVDIPYAEASSSGATSVAYRSAALKLEVTPHITPNDKISMDLDISNDSQGATVAAGPVVNTNRILTKVLADNGETIVLGGVISLDESTQWVKVPFFGDLPLIGGLFRNKYKKNNPKELLIFLTPRIISRLEE